MFHFYRHSLSLSSSSSLSDFVQNAWCRVVLSLLLLLLLLLRSREEEEEEEEEERKKREKLGFDARHKK